MKMIGSGIREALHYKPEILLEQFLDLFVEKACFILWKLNIVPPSEYSDLLSADQEDVQSA